jgi:hypothetical protein
MVAQVRGTDSGPVFFGCVDEDEDLAAAVSIAAACPGFSRDDDDECYVAGDGPTCFNCRVRRWVRGGFTCTKGLLSR